MRARARPVTERFITMSDSGSFVMSRSCQAFDLRLDERAEFLRILDSVLPAADAVAASFGRPFCLSPSPLPLVRIVRCAPVASDHCWPRLKARWCTYRLALGLKRSLINKSVTTLPSACGGATMTEAAGLVETTKRSCFFFWARPDSCLPSVSELFGQHLEPHRELCSLI